MKKTLAILLAVSAFAASASADQYVNGYVTQRGTYVAPHYRSNADSYQSNNYSYQGNTNPYTGQRGTEGYRAPKSAGFGSGLYGTSCPANSWC